MPWQAVPPVAACRYIGHAIADKKLNAIVIIHLPSMALPAFKIFTVLENLTAYAEVTKIHSLLQNACGVGQHSECLMMDFSLFNHEPSWEQAVKEAGTADAIIISITGASELPAPIQRWIDNWKNRVLPNETTLIIVLGPESRDPVQEQTLLGHFQAMAAKHGLDLFCNRPGHKPLVPLTEKDPS
jgi:hypothetical protein